MGRERRSVGRIPLCRRFHQRLQGLQHRQSRPARPGGHLSFFELHGMDPDRRIHRLVCDGQGGLLALDISTPSTPTFLGRFDTPGNAMHVVLQGATALVGDDFAGLRILDVSNPAAISELAHLDRSENSTLGIWSDGVRSLRGPIQRRPRLLRRVHPATPTERAVLVHLWTGISAEPLPWRTLAVCLRRLRWPRHRGPVSDPCAPRRSDRTTGVNNRIYHSVVNGSASLSWPLVHMGWPSWM